MKTIHVISFILLIVGGLNWLLVGLFQWDISALLGGMDSMLARTIYVLVGVAAVIEAVTHKSACKHCESAPEAPKAMGSM